MFGLPGYKSLRTPATAIARPQGTTSRRPAVVQGKTAVNRIHIGAVAAPQVPAQPSISKMPSYKYGGYTPGFDPRPQQAAAGRRIVVPNPRLLGRGAATNDLAAGDTASNSGNGGVNALGSGDSGASSGYPGTFPAFINVPGASVNYFGLVVLAGIMALAYKHGKVFHHLLRGVSHAA